MSFLRNILSSCLGVFLALIFFVAVGIIAVAGVASSFTDENTVVIEDSSVLKIDLSDMVVDYLPQTDNPFKVFFDEESYQLSSVLNAIENAKYDDNIKGISIQNTTVNAGVSQIFSIRKKILEFKETGKFVIAYADFYSQKNYYLSSVADAVYLMPFGGVEFKGLSTEVLYFKDLQEKSGVKMEVIRHGKYKSAVEGFLENEMSVANREQITSFLGAIWNLYLDDISLSRKIPKQDLNEIADNLDARTSRLSIANKIIDDAIYFDQYSKIIDSLSEKKNINIVDLQDYIKSGKGRIPIASENKIAVIYAQGEMKYGVGNETYIGQESIIKAIKSVKSNDEIKAVVLRVNSPGGVALTADLIWRELELLKKEKPLVVSMGDYAASGGYWVSANANKIYAEPTTITGSIGVFGVVPNFNQLSKDIGVNAEQVGTNKQSVGYSVFEPMNKDFYNVQKEGVELVYNTFLERVSKGRNLSIQQVDSVAQGRVWTGSEAVQIGLVDELGGIEDAIHGAAELAGLVDYRTTDYPRYKDNIKDIFKSSPIVSLKKSILKSEIGVEQYQLYTKIKTLSNYKGIYTKLPFTLEIR